MITTTLPYDLNKGEARATANAASAYNLVSSSKGRWPIAANPNAGRREAKWLERNRTLVADNAQPWVAIRGERIIARAATAADLFAELRNQGDAAQDALVVCVRPTRPGSRVYRIA